MSDCEEFKEEIDEQEGTDFSGDFDDENEESEDIDEEQNVSEDQEMSMGM